MTRRPWTSQDIATLRALYAETPTAAVAGVSETGNPKHAWDFLIAATRAT